MPREGYLTRTVTTRECPWLGRDLPEGMKIFKSNLPTYGCISENGVAVTLEPNKTPSVEVPLDAVSWEKVIRKIPLPSSEERVEQLRDKLEEYRERLSQYEESGNTSSIPDALCKIAVLETLLRDGRADRDEVRERLLEEHGAGCLHRFNSAFFVIHDYCETGGANVFGGTGLSR